MWLRHLSHVRLLLLFLCLVAASDASWNREFDPSEVTHSPGDYVPQNDDVTVLVPRPGAGRYVGFLTKVTNWPDQLTHRSTEQRHLSVSAFLGIPYAAKPGGNLRFQLPQPAYLDSRRPWVARANAKVCLQNAYINYAHLEPLKLSRDQASEDCLYLNLFVPGNASENGDKNLPVLAHIHGGSLIAGGTHAYPGQVLAAKGIVVATIAYRLGPFGFLSTGDQAAPGNFGLWDQRRALMWLRDNVQYFGGDPSKVTLSGESAGAASVGLHILSDGQLGSDRRPLFHKAVLMSGSDTANWAVSRPVIGEHVRYAKDFARMLNCPLQSEAMVNCLKNLPAIELDIHSLNFTDDLGEPDVHWAPVVDGSIVKGIPFWTRRHEGLRNLPVMGGFTRDDSARRSFNVTGPFKEVIRRELTKENIGRKKTIEHMDDHAKLFDWMYGSEGIDQDPERKLAAMIKLIGVQEMIEPVHGALMGCIPSQHTNQTHFEYEFQYVKPQIRGHSSPLIDHGHDLQYIFGVPFVTQEWWRLISPSVNITHYDEFSTDEQRVMSDFMMTLWTNFVKFGEPTPEPVRGFKWDRMTDGKSPNKCALLNLPSQSRMEVNHRLLEMVGWGLFQDSEQKYVKNLKPVE